MKPHQSRQWINQAPDPKAAEKIADVTTIYQEATALHEKGERVLSSDEMTGIQALERLHPTLPMGPGRVERREFEYTRHGTQTLIANWNVAQGGIVAPTIGTTRTEADLRGTYQTDSRNGPDCQPLAFCDRQSQHPINQKVSCAMWRSSVG